MNARYFWIATLSWVTNGFAYTASFAGVATSDGTLSRAAVLQQVRDLAAQKRDVPQDANVVFFSVEPEMLPGGAS